MKILIIILTIVSYNLLHSQDLGCFSNPHIQDKEEFLRKIENTNNLKSGYEDFYTVRIRCHILQKSDGTGGVSFNEVYNAIDILQDSYNPYNICFSLVGINEIKNDYFHSNIDAGAPFGIGLILSDSLFKSFITPNAIDIFIQPETGPTNGGIAQGFIFPTINSSVYKYNNDAVLIGGRIKGIGCLNSHVLSHEIGHVLGLFHTFETSFCEEFVNESNCVPCGDLVCDTKASQGIRFDNGLVNDATCQYIGTDIDSNGDYYDPDPANIMEYSFLNCMQYFSNGQGARLRSFLATEPDLQKLIVPDNLFFSNEFFYNSEFYGVNNIITAENTNIESYADITFKAGYQIKLEEGFHAKLGSNFKASISDNCNFLDIFNSAKTNNETGFENLNTNNIESLIIYPNPVENEFNVKFNSKDRITSHIELTVFNILGSKISKEILYSPNEYSFDKHISINNLSSGIYTIEIKYNDRKINKQFVVK